MRKLLFLFTLAAFTLAQFSIALAADKNVATFYMNSAQAQIFGQNITMEKAALNQDGTIYIPLKYLAYSIGVTSVQDEGDKIALFKDNTVVKIKKGKRGGLQVNGKDVDLLRQGVLTMGSDLKLTYLAANMISKAFGYDVSWQGENRSLKIWQGIPLSKNDFKISGIDIGSVSLENVVAVLGDYQEISETKKGLYPWRYATYPGMTIYFAQEDDNRTWRTTRARITGNEYVSARGIRVGDSFDAMVQAYGHGFSYDDAKQTYTYTKFSPYWFSEKIEFVMENRLIKEFTIIKQSIS